MDSFISGFRLADGIHRELMEQPPYSFDQEEERKILLPQMKREIAGLRAQAKAG